MNEICLQSITLKAKDRETSLLERGHKNNHSNSSTYKKPIEALYDIFFDREEFFVQYINPLCKNIILLALLLLYPLLVILYALLSGLCFLNLSNCLSRFPDTEIII